MTGPRIDTGPRNGSGLGRGAGAKNGLGTAALVLAIVGLVFCWSVVGGVLAGVVAVVLGFLGRGRALRGEADNGAVAVAGIALGGLAVVASLAFAVIWVFAWRDTGGGDYLDCAVRAGQNPEDRQAIDRCMDTWMTNVEDRFGVTRETPGPGST